MADAVTATNQLEMSCAGCRGVFYGHEKNVISKQQVNGRWVVITMCDNCLAETGRIARGG